VSGQARDVIFEITRIGGVLRIAAVDTQSGVEVVVQAPDSISEADAQALALRKLRHVLQTAREEKSAPALPPRSGRGKLV